MGKLTLTKSDEKSKYFNKMKILFLPNWKVLKSNHVPLDRQPPDYYTGPGNYWFFKYMDNVYVDIVDVSSIKCIENFEKNKIRFYIVQFFKALFKIRKYDLVVSHGMQSGIVLALFRRIFHFPRTKHVVFEIGSFNSASESGFALKLMQFASKSLDGIIYHTSQQKEYYQKFFPWLVNKSRFVHFGADPDFFDKDEVVPPTDEKYVLCVGYAKRDWKTLIGAYSRIKSDTQLYLVGPSKYDNLPKNVKMIPFVPIKKLIEIIRNAKFCILPLQWFNYSFGQMTLLQQMALGKVVLVAKVPSVKDYVDDRKTALFYESEIVEDLKNKIELLLNDETRVREMGLAARKKIEQELNEEQMAKGVGVFLWEVIHA